MQIRERFTRSFLLFILIYLIFSCLLFWIVKDDWSRSTITTDAVNRDTLLPELSSENEICQDFVVAADRLSLLKIYVNRQPGSSDDAVLSVLIVSNGKEVFSYQIRYQEVSSDGMLIIPISEPINLSKGTLATLVLRAEGGLSVWSGNTRSAGKIQVNTETSGLKYNKQFLDGELVLSQQGEIDFHYMDYYWLVVGSLLLILIIIILYCHYCRVHSRENKINKALDLIGQYKYLLKTLVIRDFKIKYKASMLGVIWSFLNPLLMTFVYMFVFSTLFRSSIENFVVYLMSGIILFNFFSEATNLGMQSIVGNAGLITKVYMPKYILPISKVLSSGINLLISLIPLMIMMAITGVHFNKSLLLIPLLMFFLILFCVGVSLMLASAMVYFRDIQFLWGILLTILNFLSPIFYPESIIPARFITVYHMNPMYQYLFFMRTITLGGISPTPISYFYCILASTVTLLIGLFVFRKTQSQFVLHL